MASVLLKFGTFYNSMMWVTHPDKTAHQIIVDANEVSNFFRWNRILLKEDIYVVPNEIAPRIVYEFSSRWGTYIIPYDPNLDEHHLLGTVEEFILRCMKCRDMDYSAKEPETSVVCVYGFARK